MIRTRLPVSFHRLGPRDLVRFAEATAALIAASAAIKLLPFRVLVRTMGVGGRRGGLVTKRDAVAELRRGVERASRRLPWRTLCFQQGLALHWLLRRRGARSRLHYGLRRGADRLSAHVWVSLDGEILIGEEAEDPHVCVATFPPAN